MAEVSQNKVQSLEDMANMLRIHSIQMTDASRSGHPTSCSSMAEVMSVLFFHTMKYKLAEPRDRSSDRFVLSKGHAAPILYAAWAEAGLFPTADLLNLRTLTSDLEGHPTPRLSFIDVATGSLGQGLSCAAGMAYVGKYIDKASYRVYCLLGDGETAEGSVWEAMNFASFYRLDNLVAIIDVNRLGQSEPTQLQHMLYHYSERAKAFGWLTLTVDGHSVPELIKAFDFASQPHGQPTCVLMKTYKGKNYPGIEDNENWHGKPLGAKSAEVVHHLEGLIKSKPTGQGLNTNVVADDAPNVSLEGIHLSKPPQYTRESLATRLAYGTALVKLGQSCERVIALDADVKNSTFSIKFKEAFPDRFIECYIAEQNLIGVAVGCAVRDGSVVFVSTFAAFLARAYDQIRMAAISQANINLSGSHAGVSIGEDGPSQMALEDLAMFRAVPGCTIFYPSDAVSCERAVELAANTRGICFIRTSRPDTKVIYPNDEKFTVGQAKVVRQSDGDVALVIGCGVTLHSALEAADSLASESINICVMDAFTIKPIDHVSIILQARRVGGKVITVEDHYAEGGLGDAVLGALALDRDVTPKKLIVRKLAVTAVPRSGKPRELMAMFNIDAAGITKAVKELMEQ